MVVMEIEIETNMAKKMMGRGDFDRTLMSRKPNTYFFSPRENMVCPGKDKKSAKSRHDAHDETRL